MNASTRPTLIPVRTDPVVEVPVLGGGEALVPAADGLEDLATERAGGLDRLVADVERLLQHAALRPEALAEGVLGDDQGAELGAQLELLDDLAGDAGLEHHVGVDEHDDLAVDSSGTAVALGAALGAGDDHDGRRRPAGALGGAVGGLVVDDDDLDVRVGLGAQRAARRRRWCARSCASGRRS